MSQNESDPKLTQEEKEALEKDNRLLEFANGLNNNKPVPITELFPTAKPVSALQYWASINRLDAMAHLKKAIASGADINQKAEGNYTPLHGAAENGAFDNVKLLLENGADRNIKTVEGKTPLDLAKVQGHKKVVNLLENY